MFCPLTLNVNFPSTYTPYKYLQISTFAPMLLIRHIKIFSCLALRPPWSDFKAERKSKSLVSQKPHGCSWKLFLLCWLVTKCGLACQLMNICILYMISRKDAKISGLVIAWIISKMHLNI